MTISSYLKRIGRGSKGASDLSREEAEFVFAQILNKSVTDLEIGAFCLAMRMKGETSAELLGFMDALEKDALKLDGHNQKIIVLPSYNGSRRQINLVPLLSAKLQERGFQVFVHGITNDPSRVTTYQIWQELGWPIMNTSPDFAELIKQGKPIFCPIQLMSPKLYELLMVRSTLGLRNTGHVLAKLLNPFARNYKLLWQVSNYTHPEYPKVLDDYFSNRKLNVVLMRGHEGEPIASLQRIPKLQFIWTDGLRKSSEEVHCATKLLMENLDASASANFINEVLANMKPCPETINLQVNTLSTHLVN